jgi:hypothetical protein
LIGNDTRDHLACRSGRRERYGFVALEEETAATILATVLAERGASVIVIDADQNGGVVDWARLAGVPATLKVVTAAPGADDDDDIIIRCIDQAAAEADFVMVDLEGRTTGLAGYAIAIWTSSSSRFADRTRMQSRRSDTWAFSKPRSALQGERFPSRCCLRRRLRRFGPRRNGSSKGDSPRRTRRFSRCSW